MHEQRLQASHVITCPSHLPSEPPESSSRIVVLFDPFSSSTTHSTAMDVLKAVQTYVNKMVGDVPGMKVLLLDAHTVSLRLVSTLM